MLIAPGRVFRTAAKPRWLGGPMLSVGLVVLYFVWLMVTDTSQLKTYFQ